MLDSIDLFLRGHRAVFFVVLLLLTFCLTVLISRRLIPYLKSKKMKQKILEIGPRWHKSKEGTPTMGGLAFIAASAVSAAAALAASALLGCVRECLPFLIVFGYAVLSTDRRYRRPDQIQKRAERGTDGIAEVSSAAAGGGAVPLRHDADR